MDLRTEQLSARLFAEWFATETRRWNTAPTSEAEGTRDATEVLDLPLQRHVTKIISRKTKDEVLHPPVYWLLTKTL